MPPNAPAPDPEFAGLLAERDFLRDRVAALACERDHAIESEGPNLQGLYYREAGFLEIECLRIEFDCARVKREIDMLTAAANRGEEIDYRVVIEILDAEFAEWQSRIARQTQVAEQSMKRLDHLMTPENSEEFRTVYRTLVKMLHPDLVPKEFLAEMRPLWDRLQRAHANSDLAEMRLIELIYKDRQIVEPLPAREALEQEVHRLKKQCSGLINWLSDLRSKFPFTLAPLLNNPSELAAKRQEFEERKANLAGRLGMFRSQLQILLDGSA